MKIELIIMCVLSFVALRIAWRIVLDIRATQAPASEETLIWRGASTLINEGGEAEVVNLIERFKRNGDEDHPYCKALQSAMTMHNVSKTIAVLANGLTP